jgi:hypothetical protein
MGQETEDDLYNGPNKQTIVNAAAHYDLTTFSGMYCTYSRNPREVKRLNGGFETVDYLLTEEL